MALATSVKTCGEMLEFIRANQIHLLDCCFADAVGLWHHCSFHVSQVDEKSLQNGFAFDGSSIRIFSTVDCSDMAMVPDGTVFYGFPCGQICLWHASFFTTDPTTCWIDPFHEERVLHVTCDIVDPYGKESNRCPRGVAKRCTEWIKSEGIADVVYVGPEAEFFVLDDVKYTCTPNKVSYEIDCLEEGIWNSDGKASNHVSVHFPVCMVRGSNMDLRTKMLMTMGDIGIPIEKHHHEVASCQQELGFTYLPLVGAADAMMSFKYVVKNVAQRAGKTATFMPKPLANDNGSGMHCHQSLWKDGKNLFFDSKAPYMKLSQLALWYTGGLLKHAPAVMAFTNSTTNSYKRLVPGYEAPSNLTYSKGNRSAAIRIPLCDADNPKAKRLEFRCPDAAGNPYLSFAAMVMAGIDGIRNKIDPPEPHDCDTSALEHASTPSVPVSLLEALDALERDHQFLLEGKVFSSDFIHAYIQMKRSEVEIVETTPHPREFELYYHC